MSVSFLGRHANALILPRLNLPYLVFLSGMVIGCMASLSLGAFETDRNEVGPPYDPPIASGSSPSHRGLDALSTSRRQVPVFFYIVDSKTKASALAEAMNKASGAHANLAMTAEVGDPKAQVGLAMVVAELTNAGVSVQLVDLRN